MLLPLLVVGTTFLAISHAAPAKKGHKAPTSDLLVDLDYAQYQGITSGPHINSWLGIRYAEPPLKDLRFRAPVKPKKMKGVQKADKHGDWCLPTPSKDLTKGASEDCLFLDVMAPSDRSKKHPVFIFIQGGGMNGNASPNMNGSQIIENGENDIVVVTFNYRVGPFGFLASKEIAEDGTMNNGNRDQYAVLKWVNKNIEKFGGDKSRVTIGGASAGAASVNLLLTAFGGRDDGYFQAAAGESNSFGAQLTIEEAQYQYDALIKRVKCDKEKDTLKCLRKVDIKTLVKENSNQATPGGKKTPVFMYSNVIDKDFTQDYTYNALNKGKFIKVPTIFGGVTNEGSIFTPKEAKEMNNEQDQKDFLSSNWVKLNSTHLDKITGWYNDTSKETQFPGKGKYWRTTSLAYGHMRYNCPGITLNQRYASDGKHKTWHYHWDVLNDGNKASGMGVIHTAESGSIWGTAKGLEGKQNPIIGKYWTSLIRTGDVNTLKDSKAPHWDEYDMKDQKKMHFVNDPEKNAMEKIDDDMLEKCAYFAQIGPDIRQ